MTINSVQNFKTVARLLLGEKFVWVVGGGGGGGWVLKVTLVLRFGPNLAFGLRIWTWTKLNNYQTLLNPLLTLMGVIKHIYWLNGVPGHI